MRVLAVLIAAALVACSPAATDADKNPPPQSARAQIPAAPAPAAPAAAPAHTDAAMDFQSPTGNVGCNYIPAGGTQVYTTPDGGPQLVCDRVEPTYVRITLSAHGGSGVLRRVGDAGCCGGATMAYGAHWTGGPFTCDMTQEGLTCTNLDGRGFTLSRDQALPH